jgi:hypothetical protein
VNALIGRVERGELAPGPHLLAGILD